MSQYTYRRVVFLSMTAADDVEKVRQLLNAFKRERYRLDAVVIDEREVNASKVAHFLKKALPDSIISIESVEGDEAIEKIALRGHPKLCNEVTLIISSQEYSERTYELECWASMAIKKVSYTVLKLEDSLILKNFMAQGIRQ